MISLLLGLPHYAVVHIIGHKCVCVCVLYTYNIHQYTYSKSIYIYIYRHRFTRFTYIKYDYFDDSFLLLSAAIGGCGSAIHPSEVYNFPRAMAESKHRRLGMDQCLATVFWNGSYVVIYIQDYIYIYVCIIIYLNIYHIILGAVW